MLRQRDLLFAIFIIIVISVLVIPIPSFLLDVGLAVSITLSTLILLVAIMTRRALDFSSFPTVLLVATMIRLTLNMSSTRLILTNGHAGTHAAGDIIEAFGTLVMGGNFVIGIVVFIILAIVSLVVVNKGSGRIAEVGARFSLDAMPGKQMAIDADLSAGLIDEGEARRRRKDLEDESSFYGAMDGASKFVKGDAIAGMLIVIINIVGGLIIGVLQHGMSFTDAAQTYTILTVGDGLVASIPSILVSVGAGMLVSKAGVGAPAGEALADQLSASPKALATVAALLVGLSLTPGMPMLPFLGLAAIMGGAAWKLPKMRAAEAARIREAGERQEEKDKTGTPFTTGLDHLMLSALAHSYDGFPAAQLPAMQDMADTLTTALSAAFSTAIQLSTPFLVLGLAFNIGLALANRALPQLPVFFVGLPASLAGGLIVLMIAIPAILIGFADAFEALFTAALP
jgi:flagellar biosynthesis protein FlhA